MLTTAETLVSACLSLPTIRGGVTERSDPKLTMSVTHHGSSCPSVHSLMAFSVELLQDKKPLPPSNARQPYHLLVQRSDHKATQLDLGVIGARFL